MNWLILLCTIIVSTAGKLSAEDSAGCKFCHTYLTSAKELMMTDPTFLDMMKENLEMLVGQLKDGPMKNGVISALKNWAMITPDFIKKYFNPNQFCMMSPLCKNSTRKPTRFEREIEIEIELECEACKVAVKEAHDYVSEPDFKSELEMAVKYTCRMLGETMGQLCQGYISAHMDYLVRLIKLETSDAQNLCEGLGACPRT